MGVSPQSGILPGAYLEGRFLVQQKKDVIVIPSDVVMYRGDKKFVYVANGDLKDAGGDAKAKLVEIQTGEGRGGKTIVTSGLEMGNRLIVSGNRTLFDGAPITATITTATRRDS